KLTNRLPLSAIFPESLNNGWGARDLGVREIVNGIFTETSHTYFVENSLTKGFKLGFRLKSKSRFSEH
ncbi:UNVERIFIED_CONTAM: hypothetical protein RF648_18580, partial [Kocuria sp. CPCC 205274]